MSDALHPIRLWWCAGQARGIARHDGVEVVLRARPAVLRHIGRLIELEYSPGVRMLYVQEMGAGRRDLESGEAAECLAYLRAVSADTRYRIDVGIA